jgi:hypothetical protein
MGSAAAKIWPAPGDSANVDGAMPPNNKDAEESLVGSMLRDNGIIPDVLGAGLTSEHFYGYAIGQVFQSVVNLYGANASADIVTASEELGRMNKKDDADDTLLATLFDAAPCAANYKEYARIIMMKAARRRLIEDGQERVRRVFDECDDLGDLIPSLGGARLATTFLSTVQPQPVRWFVQDLIPLGKLTLLAGDGGNGKSRITLDLAASASVGRPAFGLIYDSLPPCDTLLISCEDDAADTIVPRLLADKADLRRVHLVEGIDDGRGKRSGFCLANIDLIRKKLQENRSIKLVVVDPVGGFIGRAVDDHKDAEVRALLDPLARLAAEFDVAFILIKHLGKSVAAKAVGRVLGSVAWVNSVRCAYVAVPDDDDESRRLLLPIKSNITNGMRGLAYQTIGVPPDEASRILWEFPNLADGDRDALAKQLFRIEWLGYTSKRADELSGTGGSAPPKIREAADWLSGFLGIAERPVKEVREEADKLEISAKSLYAAKDLLKVIETGQRGSLKWAMPSKPSAVDEIPP